MMNKFYDLTADYERIRRRDTIGCACCVVTWLCIAWLVCLVVCLL